MIQAHSISEPGGHPVNEDALEIAAHPGDGRIRLFAIADGQGGQPGGARAARLAGETVVESIRAGSPALARTPAAWLNALRAADQRVERDAEAGYTTLIGFGLADGRIVGASSGDSALVLLNRSGASVLTERQPKNPPIGCGSAGVREFAAELGADWRVLAMTDGVWKYVGLDRVIETARTQPPAEVLSVLLESARLPGSGRLQDDFTAILIVPDAAASSR